MFQIFRDLNKNKENIYDMEAAREAVIAQSKKDYHEFCIKYVLQKRNEEMVEMHKRYLKEQRKMITRYGTLPDDRMLMLDYAAYAAKQAIFEKAQKRYDSLPEWSMEILERANSSDSESDDDIK